jgi:hypothetical protein
MSVEARSARGSHLPVFECIEISSGVERKGATAKSYRFERSCVLEVMKRCNRRNHVPSIYPAFEGASADLLGL